MWTVYLMVSVLTVIRAYKLPYCQELLLRESGLRKDVATVVFTMDGACGSCYREIQNLARLRTQMARLGHHADVLVAINRLPHERESQIPSDVSVDFMDAWTKLGQVNGHVFVFDKCGKLAYQVITPWSRQTYPFTAMAGLSALYDAPCGECNATSQTVHEFQEDLAQDIPKERTRDDLEGAVLPRGKLPLTITIRARHEHILNGNPVTYDVVELNTNDPNYHGHGDAGHAVVFGGSKPNQTREQIPIETTISQETSQDAQAITDSSLVSESTTTSQTPRKDQEDFADLLKRYQPLMKWKSCAKLVMSISV